MVKPRLINPIRVEILQYPSRSEEQDDIWRTPVRETEEILSDPNSPRVIVKAQLLFRAYEELDPMPTGSDEGTDGYLIISEADQDRYRFKTNDHVIRLLPRGGKCREVQLRIIEVRPVAQRANFGLYRLTFKDDARGLQA